MHLYHAYVYGVELVGPEDCVKHIFIFGFPPPLHHPSLPPSILFLSPEDPLFSHHAKSSPVPIKRRSNPPSSAYSMSPSPKHSISPVSRVVVMTTTVGSYGMYNVCNYIQFSIYLLQHRSSSVDVSNFSPSSFSGPPLSHRVGSRMFSYLIEN